MSFLAPGRLWLLLAVVLLAVGYLVLQRRRPAYAVRFTELDLLASVAGRAPGWRRHVPAGLLLLSLVALTAAFARPETTVSVPREQANVVVAIDVSLSMDATDVSPDRITAAKNSAAEFVAGLPDDFAVGLVSFSGVARIVVAPTRDHAAVQQAIAQLQLGPATAIGEAVFASLEALRAVPVPPGGEPAPAQVVLLGDGAQTVGRSVEQAAAAAAAEGVPVSTIAFGTPEGVVEVQGQRIPVPADEPTLEQLAETTGGRAYVALTGEQLGEVYDDIATQVGTVEESREVTAGVTGLGLALAALAAALSLLWTARLP